MKKIEATIQINKIDVVTSAIIGIVDGFKFQKEMDEDQEKDKL